MLAWLSKACSSLKSFSLSEERFAHAGKGSSKVRRTVEQLEDRRMLSASPSFKFDFSLDSNGFFNTQAKKDVLVLAGKMLTDNLTDTLSAIKSSGSNSWSATITNPGTGGSVTKSNLNLGEGQILVYAGGRNISELGIGGSSGRSWRGTSSWGNTVMGRGQSGALATTKTDVAPATGSVTFDTQGRSWHFGKTTRGLSSGETDFLSVAVHELTHVLGINNGNQSWLRLNSNGRFTGAKVKAAFGNNVRLDSGKAHWAEGTKADGGLEAAMDPTLTSGTRKLLTSLDLTGLDDIGWTVTTRDDTINTAKHELTHFAPSGGIGEEGSVLFNGLIGSSTKDVDMYRVYGEAGTVLSVSVRRRSGGVALDTYVRLYNSAGEVVKTADQGGVGGTDSLTYTLPRKDFYYIAVSSYRNRSYSPTVADSGPGGTKGDYTIGISMA